MNSEILKMISMLQMIKSVMESENIDLDLDHEHAEWEFDLMMDIVRGDNDREEKIRFFNKFFDMTIENIKNRTDPLIDKELSIRIANDRRDQFIQFSNDFR